MIAGQARPRVRRGGRSSGDGRLGAWQARTVPQGRSRARQHASPHSIGVNAMRFKKKKRLCA
ncbi:hypothetical protein OAO87_03540 [bacterium]|nr:hypothetical protein [bacterium]